MSEPQAQETPGPETPEKEKDKEAPASPEIKTEMKETQEIPQVESPKRMSLDGSSEVQIPVSSPRKDESEVKDDKEDKSEDKGADKGDDKGEDKDEEKSEKDDSEAEEKEEGEESGSEEDAEEEEGDEGAESSAQSAASPLSNRRGPVWLRLYKDHELRQARLVEKREMIRTIEEEELFAMQQQLFEDRKWVENRREFGLTGGCGMTIDDRMQQSGQAWFERLYNHAEEKRERLLTLQEKFLKEDEEALLAEIQEQHEERQRMCNIFLADREDVGMPVCERLFNEAGERVQRAEARDIANMERILRDANMGGKKKKSGAEEGEGEDEEEDGHASEWHERLHAEHARRLAALALRREKEAQEEKQKFEEEAIALRNTDGPQVHRGEDSEKYYDRLFNDAAHRDQQLDRARSDDAKRLQEYMDLNMARWMTETKKSRECWPMSVKQGGTWFQRLHSDNEDKAKAFSVERQRKRFQEEKELEAGRNYLHQMVAGNQKKVVAHLKVKDPCERLYNNAIDHWKKLSEERERKEINEVPSFKPQLMSKPLADGKVIERGEPKDIGARLHKIQAANTAKFQEQFLHNCEEEEKYCRDAQEERLQLTKDRVAKIAPALLEDTTAPWERLHYIPKHWLVEPLESPRKPAKYIHAASERV
eukprot:gnl/MRDRNA2_/MRDRNA2_89062_c0_seq1.p1 gnl/MRDRNA2_/MRDRNA2_89062_c0~~gnl/MRDRNA2_/MRDRNA2_89062_c0_seq1.p1  ORF type:complete len:650 (-),score=213.50 gnl/MRDRNA2_/MRDRNA2_89062_c0_seq1:11-1960(-)